jgi:hypothetical protein
MHVLEGILSLNIYILLNLVPIGYTRFGNDLHQHHIDRLQLTQLLRPSVGRLRTISISSENADLDTTPCSGYA